MEISYLLLFDTMFIHSLQKKHYPANSNTTEI